MSKMPLTARGRRPAFFEDKAIDSMVTIMLELMTELWVSKERQHALEAVLEAQMPGLADKLEAWQPSDEARAELDAQRQQYLSTVLRTLEANFAARAEIQAEQDEFSEKTIAEGNS